MNFLRHCLLRWVQLCGHNVSITFSCAHKVHMCITRNFQAPSWDEYDWKICTSLGWGKVSHEEWKLQTCSKTYIEQHKTRTCKQQGEKKMQLKYLRREIQQVTFTLRWFMVLYRSWGKDLTANLCPPKLQPHHNRPASLNVSDNKSNMTSDIWHTKDTWWTWDQSSTPFKYTHPYFSVYIYSA